MPPLIKKLAESTLADTNNEIIRKKLTVARVESDLIAAKAELEQLLETEKELKSFLEVH